MIKFSFGLIFGALLGIYFMEYITKWEKATNNFIEEVKR